jgi:hypothetical protein
VADWQMGNNNAFLHVSSANVKYRNLSKYYKYYKKIQKYEAIILAPILM